METFAVIVGEGDDEFTIYYDDYGNACECALSYREMGQTVRMQICKELRYN